MTIFDRFSLKRLIFLLKLHILRLQLAKSFLLLFAFSFASTDFLIVLSIAFVKVTFLEMSLPGLVVVLAGRQFMMLFHVAHVRISFNSGLNCRIREVVGGDAFALRECLQVRVAGSRLLY